MRPEHCTFVLALPAERADYDRARRDAERRHFTTLPGLGSWEGYERVISLPLLRALAEFEALGVRVVREATLESYVNTLQDPNSRVVSLFTHTVGAPKRIEFADGMHASSAVLRAMRQIAPLRQVVLDYQACALADEFAPQVRALAPNAVVRAYVKEPSVAWSLYFYRVLYRLLYDGDDGPSDDGSCFVRAYDRAAREIRTCVREVLSRATQKPESAEP